jgi:hypothetical protein
MRWRNRPPIKKGQGARIPCPCTSLACRYGAYFFGAAGAGGASGFFTVLSAAGFFTVLSAAGAAFAGPAGAAFCSAANAAPRHVTAKTTATINDRNLFIVLTSKEWNRKDYLKDHANPNMHYNVMKCMKIISTPSSVEASRLPE